MRDAITQRSPESRRGGRNGVGKGSPSENGTLVLNKREANRQLSENIGPVVRRRNLFKLDSPVKLGKALPTRLLEKNAR